MKRLVVLVVAMALSIAACTATSTPATGTPVGNLAVRAPVADFPPDAEWLNISLPLSLSKLNNKIVVAYFWRSSCLSCLEMLTEIQDLQDRFTQEVVVVAVHTPKFPREADPDAIRSTLLRYQYDGPVINDRDLTLWDQWGIEAWPSVAIIDPDGNLAGGFVGSNSGSDVESLIESLIEERREDIDVVIRVFPVGVGSHAPTVLSFPEAVLVDADQNRLFIADTGHHRIVVVELDTGEVLSVIGSGDQGLDDGTFETASFSQPRGMALDGAGTKLFVADTANHLIRSVDLSAGNVETVAGTGQRGGPDTTASSALRTDLNAPLDLAFDGAGFIITMTGSNQMWRLDLADQSLEIVAGTGTPGTASGIPVEAEFAAPSGLARDASGRLFVADAESSAIRTLSTDRGVELLAGGTGTLFEFGDRDGTSATARLQWPLGIAVEDGTLWVADTYNSKIKHINIATGEVATLVGGEGWRDGPEPLFSSPTDVDFGGGRLYVADRDNHSVRVIDPASGETSTLILKGIERLVVADDEEFEGRILTLDPVEVGVGPGQVRLTVLYPAGYKANDLAPSRFEWTTGGDVVVLAPTADRSVARPSFPMTIEATFAIGEGSLRADLWLVYCESVTESICLFDRARLNVPITVTADGPSIANLSYEVVVPPDL